MRDRIPLEAALRKAPVRDGGPAGPVFEPAVRQQQSLLAPLERRCLLWLAVRLPIWITSDHLTALGLLALAGAGACYASASAWPETLLLVNVCLAMNWFGDSLDGTLARVRNRQRPRYGFYVDHVVDAFGALFILTGLAVSGYATPLAAIALLVSFLLFSIEVYLATYTLGTFKLSYGWMSPTELRILLAIGNIFAWWKPNVVLFDRPFLFFDVGFLVATVGMFVMLIVSIVRNTRTLYLAEKP